MKIEKHGEYHIPKALINVKTLSKIKSFFTYEVKNSEEIRSAFRVTKNYVAVPRAFAKLSIIFPNEEIEDKTIYPKFSSELKISKSFSLRPNQKIAITKILDNLKNTKDKSTILKAAPGFGKSYILPAIVSALKTNTLIIVDRTNLAQQMEGEFLHNCEVLDMGIINGKNRVAKTISIATFQFLIRNEEFIKAHRDYFGLICIDECHTIGSEVFTSVIGKFRARYRLGLSATPTRSDNLTELLHDVVGMKVVNGVSDNNLTVTMLNVSHPAVKGYCDIKKYKAEYAKFILRPNVLDSVLELCGELQKKNRVGFIYITEVIAQENYALALKRKGLRVAVINQNTSSSERLSLLEKMESDQLDFLISGSILQKGISIKRLDNIINLSNLTKEAHEQLIGRLRRHHATKGEPLFMDFQFGGTLLWKGIERANLARALSAKHKDKFVNITIEKLLSKIKK